uniref:C2H2-type domain-containing protein n=1 Tax=Trichogramma kaykai TaxID=54128 RepID=A0ABD2XL02_9HYME
MANYDQQVYCRLNVFDEFLGDEQLLEQVIQPREFEAASGETVPQKSNSNELIPLKNIDNIWNKYDLFKTDMFVEQEYEVIDPNLFKRAPYHDKSSSINCQSTSQDEQKEYQYDELNLTADDPQNKSNLDEAAVETQNEENWINETNQIEPRAKKPRTVLNQLQLKIIQKREIKTNVNVSRREEAAEAYFICDGCNKTFQHKTSLTRHKKNSCPPARKRN